MARLESRERLQVGPQALNRDIANDRVDKLLHVRRRERRPHVWSMRPQGEQVLEAVPVRVGWEEVQGRRLGDERRQRAGCAEEDDGMLDGCRQLLGVGRSCGDAVIRRRIACAVQWEQLRSAGMVGLVPAPNVLCVKAARL